MIDRVAFLRAVRDVLPSLAPWSDWFYKESSHLFFGGSRLSSQRGVQQGDPLGPLLFALALQPILRRLATLRGETDEVLEVCFAYLDDCVFAGNFSCLNKVIALLRDASEEI